MKHPIKNLIACTANRREGISIIEVLTSLVVAAIGVSGVLVLIPFAVRQSQLGIERDIADVVGVNATEELQVRGFTSVFDNGNLPWQGGAVPTFQPTGTPEEFLERRTTPVLTVPVPATALAPEVVHIDPLAITTTLQQRLELGILANSGFPTMGIPLQPNPDVLTRYVDNALKIPVMNLQRRSSVAALQLPLGLTEARLLTQSTDELPFSETDYRGFKAGDIDGPQPQITLSGGGSPVARQFQGRVSWSAVMVPEKAAGVIGTPALPTPASRYRMHTLVYADRNPRSTATGIDVENGNDMFVAHVPRFAFAPSSAAAVPPDQRRDSSPNPLNLNGGFVPSVNRIVLDAVNHTQADGSTLQGIGFGQVNIVKDNWVMLINRKLPGPPSRGIVESGVFYGFDVEEAGYDLQVAFCRVTSVDQGQDNNGNGVFDLGVDRPPSLSVEGGPFNFYYSGFNGSGHPGEDTRIVPPLPPAYTSATYVVHLKDVINVFERTITLE